MEIFQYDSGSYLEVTNAVVHSTNTASLAVVFTHLIMLISSHSYRQFGQLGIHSLPHFLHRAYGMWTSSNQLVIGCRFDLYEARLTSSNHWKFQKTVFLE